MAGGSGEKNAKPGDDGAFEVEGDADWVAEVALKSNPVGEETSNPRSFSPTIS